MKSKEISYPKKLEIKLVENTDINPLKGQLQFPAQIYEIFKGFKDKHIKTMIAVYLTDQLDIIAWNIIGQGNEIMVNYNEDDLFGQIYALRAKHFILVQNNPSGLLKPLPSEWGIIEDLKFASHRMRKNMLDYIIIGDLNSPDNDDYWSLSVQRGHNYFGKY